jgi:hypothetical protein
VTVHKPTAMWMRQHFRGTTQFAKSQAAEQLGIEAVALASAGLLEGLDWPVHSGLISSPPRERCRHAACRWEGR